MQSKYLEAGIVVASIRELAERFAAHTATAARRARAGHGRYALAVPGGSVADQLLPALARAELKWSCVDIFFCDERCVPRDSADSNFAAVKRHLLEPLRRSPPRVHRMQGEDPDPFRAAQVYAEAMHLILGTPPVLDLALLGVGEDGHVASLFPGRPSLSVLDRVVLVEIAAPKAPPRRLSLSLESLARARELVVAAFGSAKAAAVGDALRNATSTLPLALLLRRAGRVTVLLDEGAASELGR